MTKRSVQSPGASRVRRNVDLVKTAVSEAWGIPEPQILQKGRNSHVATARHAAIWILVERFHIHQSEVARQFERDPTTILYGFNKAKELRQLDPVFRTRLANALEIVVETEKALGKLDLRDGAPVDLMMKIATTVDDAAEHLSILREKLAQIEGLFEEVGRLGFQTEIAKRVAQDCAPPAPPAADDVPRAVTVNPFVRISESPGVRALVDRETPQVQAAPKPATPEPVKPKTPVQAAVRPEPATPVAARRAQPVEPTVRSAIRSTQPPKQAPTPKAPPKTMGSQVIAKRGNCQDQRDIDAWLARNGGANRFESGTFLNLLERSFMSAGKTLKVTYPKGRESLELNGKTIKLADAVKAANAIRQTEGLAPLSVPSNDAKAKFSFDAHL